MAAQRDLIAAQRANPTEERLQTLGIGNVRLVVAGLRPTETTSCPFSSNAFLTADPIVPLPLTIAFIWFLLFASEPPGQRPSHHGLVNSKCAYARIWSRRPP
jgi:hypothetical protein